MMENTYTSYIPINQKWMKKMPAHWEAKRLKSIFALRKEKNNPIVTDNILSLTAKQGVVPYAKKEDVGGNKPKEDLALYNIAHENDLLVNCMNVVSGAAGVSRYYGAISPVYYALFPRKNDNVWYYHYIFRLLPFQRSLVGLGKGIQMHESEDGTLTTVRMRISMDSLGNVLLPIPPRTEQDQIVRFLDWKVSVINRLIGIRQRQIERLEEMRKAIIHKAVTKGLQDDVPMKDSGIDWIGEIPAHWIITNIKRKCKQVGSGTTPQTNDESYYNGNINWIQSGDLYNRDFINKTKKQLTQEAIKDYTVLKIYNAPFIVLAMYGASVGNVSISNVNSCVNQACCVLIPQEDISIFFMYYWLKFCKDDFISQSVGGGQPNISQAKIKDEIFAFPPRLEQEKIHKYIVEKNSVLDKTIDVKKHQITCLQELKTRLIIDTVTGKIDVRNIEIPEYEFVGEESQAEEEFDAEGSDNGE